MVMAQPRQNLLKWQRGASTISRPAVDGPGAWRGAPGPLSVAAWRCRAGRCAAHRSLIALYNRFGCTIPCFPRKATAVVHPRCGDSAPGSNSEQLPQEKARTQGNCPRWREAKRGCGLTDEETFAPIVTPAVAITLPP